MEVTDSLLEYSAGLIRTAQPTYAIKLLTLVNDKNDLAEEDELEAANGEDTLVKKGMVLALLGDAHMALGRYSQAQTFYTTAVMLRSVQPKTNKAICYGAMIESLRQILKGGFPCYTLNRVSGDMALVKLELASYLRRLSLALLEERKSKVAKLTILKSLRIGFESAGCFLERGKIYLSAAKIFRDLGCMDLIHRLEASMLSIIRSKSSWDDAEEMLTVATVFLEIYEIRALRGEFEQAMEMGHKVLTISDSLHICKMKLSILPSLIEIMVWTKHINEAVDLMKELYFLADEDVDKSGIVWYYALCLEFLLDAGVVLESYEACLSCFLEIIEYKSKSCVLRDSECLPRLMTCVCIWQLRMGIAIDKTYFPYFELYIKNVKYNNCSQIFTCNKTWKEARYNNMAQYWVEHIGGADSVAWQNIHEFDLETWSTILFPLPIPDSCL
ncbi:hypothetical protein KM043_017955 [Ampulex compressa]|nr:hypothetical protein KM043_017955 [Ampulex compressa]